MTERPDIEDFMGLEQTATREPWFVTTKLGVGPKSDSDDQSFGMIVPIADVFGENKAIDALFLAKLRSFAPAVSHYALSLESELIALKSLLADCYRHMHDAYDEERPSRYDPPEPANRWSAEAVPLFVAIQRATGLSHGEIMDDGCQS